jgi:hypothetical protein
MIVLAAMLPVAGLYRVDIVGTAPSVKLASINPTDNTGEAEWHSIGVAQSLVRDGTDLLFAAYRNFTIYKWGKGEMPPAPINNGWGTPPSDGALLSETRIAPVGLAVSSTGDRARKLIDGSKFTGRRPEVSEILAGSSIS